MNMWAKAPLYLNEHHQLYRPEKPLQIRGVDVSERVAVDANHTPADKNLHERST
jgi:hypothetical protein